jgi:hypothetical protein
VGRGDDTSSINPLREYVHWLHGLQHRLISWLSLAKPPKLIFFKTPASDIISEEIFVDL